jgi:hypothetical protein
MNEIKRVVVQGEILRLRQAIVFVLMNYHELVNNNATHAERKSLRIELRDLSTRISQLKNQLT